ncbi:MAG: molybdenum cofactor guanylyltransferase [Armatimonadota bacterium]
MTIGLVVLAGGASRRMGRDKAMILIDGEPMAARLLRLGRAAGFDPVCLAGRPGPLAGTDAAVLRVEDWLPDSGPLGGIAGALAAIDGTLAVLAVDHPAMDPAAMAWLFAAARDLPNERAGAVAVLDGRPEPLISIWRSSALPVVRARLQAGDGSVIRCTAALDFVEIRVPADLHAPFTSANTPEEWRSARAKDGSRPDRR